MLSKGPNEKNMKSKAAVLYKFDEPLVIEEIDVAAPKAGEVMVKLAASGVCRTDLSSVRGKYGEPLPMVFGHEGAGVVVEVGPDVADIQVGDHVILSWRPSCGSCRCCTRGKTYLCTGSSWINTYRMKDGTGRFSKGGKEILQCFAGVSTFTEYTVVDQSCAVKVDKSLPLAPLSLIGCGVTTGAGAALNTANIQPGDFVAVIGCGGVGLSAIQGAKIREAKTIVAIDTQDAALELATKMGATHTINSRNSDIKKAVLEITNGIGVDFCIEAIGRTETIDISAEILARSGESIIVGLPGEESMGRFSPAAMVRGETVIRGSYYGSADPKLNFLQMTEYYKQGKLNIDSMVFTRKLEDINEIFLEMESGSLGRNMIIF